MLAKYIQFRNQGIDELELHHYEAAKQCFLKCIETNVTYLNRENHPNALYK